MPTGTVGTTRSAAAAGGELQRLLDARAAGDALSSERARALQLANFPELPDPSAESWRKTDLGGLDLGAFAFGSEVTARLEPAPAGSGARVREVNSADLSGELLGRVQSALARRLDSDRGHLFDRLAVAIGTRTVLVGSGASRAASTIELRPAGDALVAHNVLVAEPGAELVIVEDHRGAPVGEAFSLWTVATDVIVGQGAQVHFLILRDQAPLDYHFHDVRFFLERDARAHAALVHRGGFLGKTFVTASLLGPGAEFRAVGMTAMSGREFLDTEMLVEHLAEHTQSSLHYKTVLKDRAHSIFNGNLLIAPGLKHAESHQLNNNILLNRRARAESIPNLIVRAEDVSAEHGATVGQLDRDALFYLMSRGVPESEARNVLIDGFIQEVLREIPVAALQEQILVAIKEKLSL